MVTRKNDDSGLSVQEVTEVSVPEVTEAVTEQGEKTRLRKPKTSTITGVYSTEFMKKAGIACCQLCGQDKRTSFNGQILCLQNNPVCPMINQPG